VHTDLPYKDFPTPDNIYQPPVPGIIQAEYAVICMDVEGNILGEERSAAPVGNTLTVTAPVFEGYVLSGEATAAVTVGENPDKNIVIFRYEPLEPTPTPTPEPGETPPDGEEPPPDGTPPDWLPPLFTPTPTPEPGEEPPPYYTPDPGETSPSPSPTEQETPPDAAP
jgi:hypothetical protein